MTPMEEFLSARPNRTEEAAFLALCAFHHCSGIRVGDQLVVNIMVHLRDEIIGFGHTPPKVPRDLSLPELHEWAANEMAKFPCRVCGGGTAIQYTDWGARPIAVRCVCEEES